jgi:hypothetical protein
MSKYTNTTGVSLPLAVWLATDNYGGKSKTNPYSISATGLLKSPRQIILGMRAKPEDEVIDVSGLVQSRIGTAIHSAIENAWTVPKEKLTNTLVSLGYPEDIAKRVKVNPNNSPIENYPEDMIPVYVEQREYKQLGKWTLTGEFDMVFDGALSDTKSTTTFTFSNKTKDEDYIKQGSFYRWLNPTKITKDTMSIDFIFTDFKQNMVGQGNYPPSRTYNQQYQLMSLADTENWIKDRLTLIETLELAPEPDLPFCTDKELWRRESQWKYYKSGVVGARSTKNFDNAADAYQMKQKDGGTGLVLEIAGAPTACLYCNVSSMCTQKDAYISTGELVI